MAFTKQTWLVVVLAVALVASLVGNWYLWQAFQTWSWHSQMGDVSSAESYSRLALKAKRYLDEGKYESVDKYMDSLLNVQMAHLSAAAEYEENPERVRRRAAEILASIEGGSLLDAESP